MSGEALRRYESGERPAPAGLYDRAVVAWSAQPDRRAKVRAAVAAKPGQTRSKVYWSLPPSLRQVFAEMVASGELATHAEATGGQRRRVRWVVDERSDRPRGLDRRAPKPIPGEMLRAARRAKDAKVDDMAAAVGVAPATWRSWEAGSLPRQHVERVAGTLKAPAGDEIARRREAAGWSQDDLGRRLGISGVYVGYVESGRRPVPAGRILGLFAALAAADEAAAERFEHEVVAAVREVSEHHRAGRPVSESELLHHHTWSTGGRRVASVRYAAALQEAKRRRLVEEGPVFGANDGPTRTGLYPKGTAPRRPRALTGDALARRRRGLRLTKREMADLCGVVASTVAAWEDRGAQRLSDRAATAAWAALARAEKEDFAGEKERRRVAKAIEANPGIGTYELTRGAGGMAAVTRSLSALEAAKAIVKADAYDGVGRRYEGWYLAGAAPQPNGLGPGELTSLRRGARWSQEALAAALGVGPRTVWRWEAGRGPIPPPRVDEIRRLLEEPPPAVGRRPLSPAAAEAVAIRLAAGLSQRQLGEQIGVTVPAVSGWETGRQPIPARRLDQLRALASAG